MRLRSKDYLLPTVAVVIGLLGLTSCSPTPPEPDIKLRANGTITFEHPKEINIGDVYNTLVTVAPPTNPEACLLELQRIDSLWGKRIPYNMATPTQCKSDAIITEDVPVFLPKIDGAKTPTLSAPKPEQEPEKIDPILLTCAGTLALGGLFTFALRLPKRRPERQIIYRNTPQQPTCEVITKTVDPNKALVEALTHAVYAQTNLSGEALRTAQEALRVAQSALEHSQRTQSPQPASRTVIENHLPPPIITVYRPTPPELPSGPDYPQLSGPIIDNE